MTKEDGSNASRTAPVPYLFVVGCPRSGTTMLQRILDAHPDLTVAYDTLFIPKGAPRLKPGKNPKLTPEIVERTRNFQRFSRLGLPEEAVDRAASLSRTYAEFVSALYGELAKLKGKSLAGEKSPGYVKRIPLLHSLFPTAKFIHIIGDGRDVALSLLDWGEKNRGPARQYELWKKEPVAVCALWWKSYVEAGRHDGGRLGDDFYYEMPYEELVAGPEEHSRKLCQFLELPYLESMVNYHQGKMRLKPGKSAWLPPTKGLRDWRMSMSDGDVAVFEALAGDLLSELGYERRALSPSAPVIEIAEKCRAAWFQHGMRKRNERVPSRSTVPAVEGPSGQIRLDMRHHRSTLASDRQQPTSDPYVFLVGCPRSGTTLLQRMLDNHPSLAIGH